jgi:16S rRNA (guanine966-N2)-methyltransferase
MRITSGFARGLTIKVPKITDIRPAQEVVRQAVFSILFDEVEDATILDMYAGSGAFGLEALSRGARHVTFIDSNPLACATIRENLTHARFLGKAEVERHDALRYLIDAHETFYLIFMAPPYAYGVTKPLLYHLAERIRPSGTIIFDHAKNVAIPKDLGQLEVVDQRSYGASAVSFMRLKAQPGELNNGSGASEAAEAEASTTGSEAAE